MLDSGLLASTVGKTVGSVATAFDRATSYADAVKLANQRAHLKRDTTGQYVGAPRDPTGRYPTVDSPQKLAAMREQVDAQTAEGAFNASWYDRARKAYMDATGYDPAVGGFGTPSEQAIMARQFSRGGAAYSPQAKPPTETENFIRQHNTKVLTGQDIVPRTGAQSRNLAKSYVPNPNLGGYDIHPEKIRLGRKTGPYAEAKDPTVDEAELFKTANDIWHGRVFGYSSPGGTPFSRGFTPQEHGFLTGENVLASERATATGVPLGQGSTASDWSPRRMQAATWGAARFRQFKKAAELRVRKAQEKLRLWEKTPKPLRKGSKPKVPDMTPDSDLIKAALAGIDQSVPRLQASETFEYVTGQNVGHLSGLNTLPEQVRLDYSQQMQNAFGGNRDQFYEGLQLYQNPTLAAKGEYTNSLGVVEFNPAYTARPLVGLTKSDLGVTASGNPRTGGPQIDPASRQAMDTVSTARAILTAQEAGAWNKFTPANTTMRASEKTGGRYEGPPDQLEAAHAAFKAEKLDVVHVGDAIHVGDFSQTMSGSAVQKKVEAAIKAANLNGGQYTKGRFESEYHGTDFTSPGSGTATDQLVSTLQSGGLLSTPRKLDTRSKLRESMLKANQIDRQFAKLYNLPVRDDLLKLRELISQVGFEGLPQHLKQFGKAGLPALAPAYLLSQQETGQAQ
jgi:hypothetical protein